MIINGLEASQESGVVTVRTGSSDRWVQVFVHNDGVIEEDVRPRIFQRYFSTKAGVGRGQGTFTMKLFGEHFLRGEVSFTSSEQDGTEFVVRIPVEP